MNVKTSEKTPKSLAKYKINTDKTILNLFLEPLTTLSHRINSVLCCSIFEVKKHAGL